MHARVIAAVNGGRVCTNLRLYFRNRRRDRPYIIYYIVYAPVITLPAPI